MSTPDDRIDDRFAPLDRAVRDVAAAREAWARTGIDERIRLLDASLAGTLRESEGWVADVNRLKGLDPGSPATGENWLIGPLVVMRLLRLMRQALAELRDRGAPRIPGGVWTRPDGQVVAGVFPGSIHDRLMYNGFSAEIWMQPDVRREELERTMAVAYRAGGRDVGVTLVLGAGNVSSIPPSDALYKLFVDNRVVVLKMNPVNAVLGSRIERAFAPLVDRGFLRVVEGDGAAGAFLVDHELVDDVHITGSQQTHDAIVFGVGDEADRRRRERSPRLTKPITSELGNVSPILVVPGPWSRADLAFQAQNLATMLTLNAGFNCLSARLIVQHAGWSQRESLAAALRDTLASIPTRPAYYPGAEDRYERFRTSHDRIVELGTRGGDRLPWMLLEDLDPGEPSHLAFREESFCSAMGTTAIQAASVPEYLDRAVAFVNEHVHGTLSASVIVHPDSLKDRAVADAVDRAVADLRYGTVAVNHTTGVAYAVGSTTWGAYPGHDIYDIGSGVGVVHNPLMFDRPQKSVLRGPFRMPIKPPWFATHRTLPIIGPRLARFEARPSMARLARMAWPILRG